MPLVTTKDMLEKAAAEGYAVGAFNATNLEMVNAIIGAAIEEEAPVIIQGSAHATAHCSRGWPEDFLAEAGWPHKPGLKLVAVIVRAAADIADEVAAARGSKPVPIALHLDHGTSYEENRACFDAGYTSLMYDGSRDRARSKATGKPAKSAVEDNIAVTKRIVEFAHPAGVPVEAEVGVIPSFGEGLSWGEVIALRTTPEEARRLARESGCDSLAVAVGNVHSDPTGSSQIDLKLLSELREAAGVPLVSHGSTGTTEEQLQRMIGCGVAKVNVATRLNMDFIDAPALAYLDAMRAYWLGEGRRITDFSPLVARGVAAVKGGAGGGGGGGGGGARGARPVRDADTRAVRGVGASAERRGDGKPRRISSTAERTSGR
jgi:fructose-bisphosphate aldolase class II